MLFTTLTESYLLQIPQQWQQSYKAAALGWTSSTPAGLVLLGNYQHTKKNQFSDLNMQNEYI